MRRILVEHARAKLRLKRGGDAKPGPLPATLAIAIDSAPEMLDLDDGLEQLAQRRPRVAKVAELRIYGGLSTAEAADVVGVSLATAKAEWALAQALLTQHVRGRQA
jgi:RNA polymerase sigma factor (TIGR02999 family)